MARGQGWERVCDRCSRAYIAQRKTSRYCGAACRVAAGRDRKILEGTTGVKVTGTPRSRGNVVALPPRPAGGQPEAPTMPEGGPVWEQTRKELDAAKRLDTAVGQAALAIAKRLDASQGDTGSAVAALARELRATMGEAMTGAPVADELAALRARKDAKVGG